MIKILKHSIWSIKRANLYRTHIIITREIIQNSLCYLKMLSPTILKWLYYKYHLTFLKFVLHIYYLVTFTIINKKVQEVLGFATLSNIFIGPIHLTTMKNLWCIKHHAGYYYNWSRIHFNLHRPDWMNTLQGNEDTLVSLSAWTLS